MKIKGLIAAGGKGTRLRPLTFTSNKHLIPIANKPLLFYPLESLISLGIKDIGVVVNESRHAVETALGNGSKWGVKFTYINQPEPLGVGHVIKVSRKFLGDSPFVYILGDNIFTLGIKASFEHFLQTKADALLNMVIHEENYRLGVPFFDDGKLIKVVEKPKNPPNKFAIPGLYMFSHHVHKAFNGKGAIKPSLRGEYEITDVYNYMIRHGYKVEVKKMEGKWLDPGKFDDSLEANRLMLELQCKALNKGKVDKQSKISGNVQVGTHSKITNSRIVGPVSIGDHVRIKNSYIGPYTSIADGCEIQGAAIEYSIIMEGADIIDVPGRIEASMIGKDATVQGTQSVNPAFRLTVSDWSKVDVPR